MSVRGTLLFARYAYPPNQLGYCGPDGAGALLRGDAPDEIARTARVGVDLVERDLPIPPEVSDACSLLGLDPLQVANEGKLLAFVPAERVDEVLAAMRAHPYGSGARRIGTCVTEHPGMVVARTALGGTRVVNMPIGEQLPRIC